MKKKPVIAPQPGKQELAMKLDVDVMIYGGAAGSGKSRLLLMKPLRFVEDSNFEGVFFRRTTKALEKPGSLWPEAKKLWSAFKARVRERDHQHIFKSGATLGMDHLEHEKDAEGNHQGTQYSFIGFDELTHFTQVQWLYLIGRLRSGADMDSFCLGTCNPDPDSWVLNWVEWYLDEEGYPEDSKCGVIRYFVIVEDAPVFRDTVEELVEEFPDLCWQDDGTGKMVFVPPLSFTFIGGTIFDNPALIKANPKYLSALKSQTAVNRARLLDGNWYARPEGSNIFDRDWLVKVDKVPIGCVTVRAWDKASVEPSDVNRYPDYTAGSPLMHKDKDGFYYITWGFLEELCDYKSKVTGRFRKRPGERDQLILKQAKKDGSDTTVIFPVDPGAAGKVEYQESAKKLIAEGFKVKPDPMPNNKSKLKRYEPFSSACQNGLVRIVESSFPNKETLEAFYKENEAFDGERSTSQRKDDWPDATASGFNALNTVKVLPKFGIGQNDSTQARKTLDTPVPAFGTTTLDR